MNIFRNILTLATLSTTALVGHAAQVTIRAVNHLQFARPAYTIELFGKDLASLSDLQKIHVKDSNGKEVLSQAVDTDLDEMHKPDILIFQSDFGPGESKTFTLSTGGQACL